jgi:hypothetical protein
MFHKCLTWTAAIERVLQESDRPLTTTEIARLAIVEGWVQPSTEWPSYSVQGAIVKHMKDGNSKGFQVVGKDLAAQRLYWLVGKQPTRLPSATRSQ